MLKMEKKSASQIFLYNNMMMYIKIDFKKKVPLANQFIIQYPFLILNE
jgi:hypothetical protein